MPRGQGQIHNFLSSNCPRGRGQSIRTPPFPVKSHVADPVYFMTNQCTCIETYNSRCSGIKWYCKLQTNNRITLNYAVSQLSTLHKFQVVIWRCF